MKPRPAGCLQPSQSRSLRPPVPYHHYYYHDLSLFFFSVPGPETKTRFAPTSALWLFQQTILQMCPERLGHTRKQMMRKTALIKLPVIMPSTDHVVGTGRHFPSSFFLTILERQRRSVFILLVVILVRIHAPADGVCHLGPCRAVCILPGRVKRMHNACENGPLPSAVKRREWGLVH